MTPIPVAPPSPAPGLALPGPGQHFTKIRATVAAVVDRLELCVKFKTAFEQVIRRLDRMQYVFDDVMKSSSDVDETLDRLSSRLKGMGETLEYTGKMSGVMGEALDTMDETVEGLVKRVCALEEKAKVMDEKITDLICGKGVVWPVRLYNHQCSLDYPLEWPIVSYPPYPAGRPKTLADLQSMDAEMCTALAAALHLPTPSGLRQPSLECRRRQIIKHLGCAECDSMSSSHSVYYY